MWHPCGYSKYVEKARKCSLEPMTDEDWHKWWDDKFADPCFNLQKAKAAYGEQRGSAGERGILWLFVFESWVSWWEAQLGKRWQNLRGCTCGKYVMARKRDQGAYSSSNVRAILGHENAIEAVKNGRYMRGETHVNAKLTKEIVAAIYNNETDSYSTMAKKYQVHQRHIAAIRNGETWNHITGHPTAPWKLKYKRKR